ncbi:serine protease AprX [Evansella vedderi]|uniref:Serine protease AprX n=1 Tax=Evansella vedderi TaxID=38282 RepID=A0ABU0A043_9BACI|nr:S8 family peptidase [Evansella vedderi]MDQ0256862.1 serine protease AprX [Evansella vedderi]
MYGFSMVQMVRTNAYKLDKPLREKVLNLYRPFKWTPCFLHKYLEKVIKRTAKLSIIIEFEEGCFDAGCKEIKSLLNEHFRCKFKKEYKRVDCCSVDITPSALEEMLTTCSHVKKVHLNRKVNALLDVAVESANARKVVRNGTELTGEGVTIAVVDTGVYEHEDLSGRVIDFVDFINGQTEPYDDNGHGTHCAGDAAGNGSASGGIYAGPAPRANIIGVKVLNKQGAGSLESVMDGVDWCISFNENNPDQKIDIINMSLGSPAQHYGEESDDPMVKIVNEAWEQGIVVCVAAGNEGPEAGTIASPGVSTKVITVGALDDRNTVDRSDDRVADFSSRGPTIYGEVKPDIVAPGVNIVSLRSPGSYLDKLQKKSRIEGEYISLSGTSMATPICAGIVALLLEYNPQLTPDEVKGFLMEGTDLWRELDPNIYGSGYINAENTIPR